MTDFKSEFIGELKKHIEKDRSLGDSEYENRVNNCFSSLLALIGKRLPKDFEDYLIEEHAEQYIGTKDCMIDDFNKWVQDLGVDELIDYGNKCLSEIRKELGI